MIIPHPYDKDDLLADAYTRGYHHGHGFACHNVPKLGATYHIDGMGSHVVITPENIREVHQSLCFTAEQYSRDYSPFEFTASEFNRQEDYADDLWEAFDEGITASIEHDLSTYTDDDYCIND